MKRFRNYRTTPIMRDLYAETLLLPGSFIMPFFITEGAKVRFEIPSLPGICRLSTDELLIEIEQLINKGINKILLFGTVPPEKKNGEASAAFGANSVVSHTVREIKTRFPQVIVFTDICLCAYTHHGYCGVLHGDGVDNDATLPLLARMALGHAAAGADFVAPSAMMDGQVAAIRDALDAKGYHQVQIMSYAAKYASSFYGPFRDAAGSAPSAGDRLSYQMDYRNAAQALGEIQNDLDEGADIVMVKPAHTYLDIISKAREKFPYATIAAYHVSGEYAMVKAAAAQGIVDEHRAFTEVLTAIKRAGANLIISYYNPF